LLRDNTYTMWESGNDGAGSSLDADLLDGLDKIYFPYALGTGNWGTTDSVTNMNAQVGHTSTTQRSGHYTYSNPTNSPNGDWVHWINHSGGSWGAGAEYGFQIAHGFWNNNMWVRKVNNGTWGTWATMWNSDNDGSGSGLDADLEMALTMGDTPDGYFARKQTPVLNTYPEYVPLLLDCE